MSLFEDTNPKALKELLGEINSRTMALPDFQRDFVWEPSATQELIVSISSDYFAEIHKTPGFPFDAVLASHCLPTGNDSPFWTDDYEAYLTWRETKLWNEIKRVTGVREPADLEASEEAA